MTKPEFTQSSDSWGLSAIIPAQTPEIPDYRLFFNGAFDKQRIAKERAAQGIYKMVTLFLWGWVTAGVASFVWEIIVASKNHNFIMITHHNGFNLLLSFGLLAALYQWARIKQKDYVGNQKRITSSQIFDVYELFDDQAKQIWNYGFTIASTNNRLTVTCLDVFTSLIHSRAMSVPLLRLGVNPQDISKYLQTLLAQAADDTAQLQQLPFIATALMLALGQNTITPAILLSALIEVLPEHHVIQNLFFNLNISAEDIDLLTAWTVDINSLSYNWNVFKKLAQFKPDNETNKGLTSIPTPYLDRFSIDVTSQAKHGTLPLTIGRAEDLQAIMKLMSESSGNVVIKGSMGTGRTTVINELAFKMASEQVPSSLQDQRLVRLELSAIIGTTGRAETVFSSCLQEAVRSGNIVLVLEEIHSLAKMQTSQGISLLELVIDFLSQNNLRVIATTTIQDYSQILQQSANFEQVFQQYELRELGRHELLLACCVRASLLETQYHCFFPLKTIAQAFSLSDQFIQNVSQPQKTIALLVEAASQTKNNKKQYHLISPETIAEIVSKKTHIPTASFTNNEAEKLLKLEQELAKNIIGQKQAVEAVAEGLRRARSGLAATNRPLASFLFLGPTGVGKTELAKTLAQIYFGRPEYLLRLDMSEFSGSDALSKLIGGPNTANDTSLIAHLKTYPFCLLLLDEFEKATSEVHNLFLQILDDGRLTSSRGETLKLSNTMIIATSNAGTQEIQEGITAGTPLETIKKQLINSTLQKFYRPELLNRFDGIIVFSPLSKQEVQQVTVLQLQSLQKQLLDKGVKVAFSSTVVDQISQNAFDPLLGARPIRRYIQDTIESFISKLLLSRQLTRGSQVTINYKDGQYQVT